MPELWNETFSTSKLVKEICLFGLLFTTSYLGYNMMKKASGKSRPIDHAKQESKSRRVKTEFSQYYFDKNLEIQMMEEELGKSPSIEDIYLQSSKISRDEFIKYTQEIRRRRRLIRKLNEDQYIELVLTYENEVQQLLTRNRFEIIAFLNISEDQFGTMQQNYDTVEDLHLLHRKSEQVLRQQLIQFGCSKKMSCQKLQAILDEQIGFVKTKMYERIKNRLQKEVMLTQNQILTVINTLQEDIIYEHFGYQKQDIERKIVESKIQTEERDKYQAILQADVVNFNYESLQESELEDEENEKELKGSLPTLGLSTEREPL